jgi:hypothetical protein
MFGQLNFMEYDGVAEFVIDDWETWDRIMADEFYQEKVKPDEESFFNAEKTVTMIGWEEKYIDQGKAVGDT